MVDVATFCGNCGNASTSEERYCTKCGNALNAPTPTSETPAEPITPTAIPPEATIPAPALYPQDGNTAPFFRQQTTNGLAIASLVLGIVWLWCLGSILALVFGYTARRQIARSNDEQKGRGLATAGIVLGWVGIAGFIALTVVIAVPQFLGARERAQDGAAQSDLRNALTAEKTFYTDTQTYTDNTASLTAIEPSLPWNAVGGPQVSVGGVDAGDRNVVCLQETSKSGTTFSIADVAAGAWAGTYYNKGTCSTNEVTVATWTGW
jgi:type II secretory pathway pseudopilin PulG